jgi:hypothetical protein
VQQLPTNNKGKTAVSLLPKTRSIINTRLRVLGRSHNELEITDIEINSELAINLVDWKNMWFSIVEELDGGKN